MKYHYQFAYDEVNEYLDQYNEEQAAYLLIKEFLIIFRRNYLI